MACSNKAKGIALSLLHLLLGVLSIVFGVVSIKLEEVEYSKGLYGMGIWLGIWMLLTCLCGLLTASSQPVNKCRVTSFIGFCCYSIVAMVVCCVPLIVGPVNHFSFESKANKEYYRKYGPESMYHKPYSYFDERNRIGRVGCAIYGSLLCVILLDIMVAAGSCFVWKQALNDLMAPRRQEIRRVMTGSLNSGYSHSVSFISPEGILQGGIINDGQYPKLPSYRDIYPDGSPAWENRPTLPSDRPSPPPYTETVSSNAPEQNGNEPSNDTSGTVTTALEDEPTLNTPINDMDTTVTNPVTTSNLPTEDTSLSCDVPLEDLSAMPSSSRNSSEMTNSSLENPTLTS